MREIYKLQAQTIFNEAQRLSELIEREREDILIYISPFFREIILSFANFCDYCNSQFIFFFNFASTFSSLLFKYIMIDIEKYLYKDDCTKGGSRTGWSVRNVIGFVCTLCIEQTPRSFIVTSRWHILPLYLIYLINSLAHLSRTIIRNHLRKINEGL